MKPVLLTLDDDPQVLLAIERDLRQHYGKRFRVLRAESGVKALAIVKQLKLQNKILSLLLVDQRMPQMTGVELLEQAFEVRLPIIYNERLEKRYWDWIKT